MIDVQAYAVRRDGVIEVTVTGSLRNSCYEAKIDDKYPGGNIVYVVDPGSAQVFIEEHMRPGSGMCLMYLVPWVSHESIPDEQHDHVTIFVNGIAVVKTQVQAEPEEYRVISLTVSNSPGHIGCSVIPADSIYPAIYSSVFGPASKDKCDAWLAENCIVGPLA